MCSGGKINWPGMTSLYHPLWFWDGEALPTASFRQKSFRREWGVVRFPARPERVGHCEGCPYGMVPSQMWRHKGEQFTPELSWQSLGQGAIATGATS